MWREEHEQKTIALFGRPFSEIHAWIDQYYPKFGIRHRIFLHHLIGAELAVRTFGDEAVRPVVVQHIEDDIGFVPKDWLSCDKIWETLVEDDSEVRRTLVRIYGRKVFDQVNIDHGIKPKGRPILKHGQRAFKNGGT